VLCAHLRWWPIDRLRRRRPELRGKLVALIETSGNKRTVIHVSPETPSNIWPGMTLAAARARHAELIDLPVTPEADLRSLEALGHWLMRFSPFVAVMPPSSFFLDATGMERLVGSLDEVRRRVVEGLAKLRIHAGVAIAPTPGAAWAMAAFGREEILLPPLPSGEGRGEGELKKTFGRLVPLDKPPHPNPLPKGEGVNAVPLHVTSPWIIENVRCIPRSLSPLPPDAFRLDTTTSNLLAELGIRTIGSLLALPRDELRVRFGPEILTRIDQALGTVHEPVQFLIPRIPIDAALEFDGAIDSLEAIRLAVQELVCQVSGQLTKRGLGARELRLIFRPSYAPLIEKKIRLVRPCRNESAMFRLMSCALETLEAEEGFISITLSATAFQRLDDEQVALIGGDEQRDLAEVDHLVERLRARVDDSVEWGELVESNLPENAFRFHNSESATGLHVAQPLPAVFRRRRKSPLPLRAAVPHREVNIFRPLRLLREPKVIGVIVRPSESREGAPVSFTDECGEVHRLLHVRGPERITGQWWQGRWKVRDYFDVLDGGGSRYWVFRVAQTGRWFLHGIFE
jgi:protein ImuB